MISRDYKEKIIIKRDYKENQEEKQEKEGVCNNDRDEVITGEILDKCLVENIRKKVTTEVKEFEVRMCVLMGKMGK